MVERTGQHPTQCCASEDGAMGNTKSKCNNSCNQKNRRNAVSHRVQRSKPAGMPAPAGSVSAVGMPTVQQGWALTSWLETAGCREENKVETAREEESVLSEKNWMAAGMRI